MQKKEHEKNTKSNEKARKHMGIYRNILQQDEMIDMRKTNKWLNLRLTAHVESYVKAIQEQELNTKETQRRREKDMQKKRTMDTKCRVSDQKGGSVYQSSLFMPSTHTKLISQSPTQPNI